MKKNLKIIACMLTGLIPMSLVACGGKDNSTITKITVVNYNGGIGGEWLIDAEKRFEELNKNTSFADGKVGVDVKVENIANVTAGTMKNSGYNIYFDELSVVDAAINQGNVMPITDIVTEKTEERGGQSISIEDKIEVDYRSALKGGDGEYYILPHYEFFPGASYDVDTFTAKGLYFAKENTDAYFESTVFGAEAYFTSDDSKKTCGPDGEYETYDDGLPTTIQELGLLCEYMVRRGVTPFELSGKLPGYMSYFLNGLWASLAGYNEIKMCYTFTGEMEIVTGESTENLFPGIGYIKKPITKKVTVTPETGWQVFSSVNRYYALAFTDIIYKEGWFHSDLNDSTVDQSAAQRSFINGAGNGKPIGILIEGSYWYNESTLADNFNSYYTYYSQDGEERKVAWMSLPTSFNESTAEGNGEAPTAVDVALSFGYINNNIANDAEKTKACKAFLKFLYSDAELSYFTESTGLGRAGIKMSNELSGDAPLYKKTLLHASNNGKVLYAGVNNKTFLKNKTSLILRNTHFTTQPIITDVTHKNVLSAYKENYNVMRVFNGTTLSAGEWNTFYVEE